jgi:hypothetical protein
MVVTLALFSNLSTFGFSLKMGLASCTNEMGNSTRLCLSKFNFPSRKKKGLLVTLSFILLAKNFL